MPLWWLLPLNTISYLFVVESSITTSSLKYVSTEFVDCLLFNDVNIFSLNPDKYPSYVFVIVEDATLPLRSDNNAFFTVELLNPIEVGLQSTQRAFRKHSKSTQRAIKSTSKAQVEYF